MSFSLPMPATTGLKGTNTTNVTTQVQTEGWTWGAVGLFALVAAAGVTLVAVANRVAAGGADWGDIPFFLGLLVIVVPISIRLLQVDVRGSERVALVVVMGMALYACKLVHDPVIPGGYDEYLHLRTAQDIVSNHAIFLPNSLLTVSPYYPGLELVAAAISQMSGIGVYESGMILLGATRIALCLALFFLFAMTTQSSRVAGIAAAIYMTNSHFLYFDSQFAYESLALPLAVGVMYLLVRRGHANPARWLGLTALAVLALLAVVTTHHVTAALLAIILFLWAFVGWWRKSEDRSHPGPPAILATGMVVFWTVVVASATFAYLGPVLTASVGQIVDLFVGNLAARQLFVSRAGDSSPLWEKLLGSASAAVVLLLLPLGLLLVRYRYRTVPIMIAFGLIAITFPLTLIARFSPLAAEVASRTPEYLFLGIAPIMALSLARLAYRGRYGALQIVGAAAVMIVLTVGGVLVGMTDWARLPGPYLVSADGRSVDAQGVAAASWTLDKLGPGNNVAADRVNRLLLSAYGRQEAATTYGTGIPIRNLFLSQELGPKEEQVAKAADIQYLLTDERLTTGLPVVGHYFDRGEEVVVGIHDQPLDPQLLTKFDENADISRVFDGGDIHIYDLRDFRPPT
jgi:4-amino-4-deoxy-L-arabinose transferase-like glycosyltransferase